MPFMYFNIVKTHFPYIWNKTTYKTEQKQKQNKKQKSCRKQALFNEIIIGRMKNSKQSNTCIKAIHFAIRCQP